jgi:hypothetical protein
VEVVACGGGRSILFVKAKHQFWRQLHCFLTSTASNKPQSDREQISLCLLDFMVFVQDRERIGWVVHFLINSAHPLFYFGRHQKVE